MPFMPRTTRNRARRRRIAYATRKPYYIPKGVATRRAPKRKYKGPKPSKSFVANMKKYNNNNLEKKIIPMKNYLNGPGSQGYLQDLPAQGLTSAGLTDNALSALVLQTGSVLTNSSVKTLHQENEQVIIGIYK